MPLLHTSPRIALSLALLLGAVAWNAAQAAKPATAGKPLSPIAIAPPQSTIHFSVTQMGAPVSGHFKRFGGTLQFDPQRLADARVELWVEPASGDLGSDEGNQMLPGENFFDTARYPRAQFQAKGFRALGPDAQGQARYQTSGNLTLKGKSAVLTLPFTLKQQGTQRWLEGSFPLSRLAWHVGANEWEDTGVLADAVQVGFRIALP